MLKNSLSFNSKKEISAGLMAWLMRIGLLAGVLVVAIPSVWLFQRFIKTEFAKSLAGRSGITYVVSLLPGVSGPSPSKSGGSSATSAGSSGAVATSTIVGGVTGGVSTVPGGSSTTTTTPAMFSSQCAQRGGTKVTVSGLQKVNYRRNLTANTVINAINSRWDGTTSAGAPIAYPIAFGGEGPACWYGSSYTGIWNDLDPAITWANTYHSSGAMTIRSPNFLVESFKVTNLGDGIRMEGNAGGFKVRGVQLIDMHDDCIENDALVSGVVEDSLLNGCYVAFSADDFTLSQNGSANTWQINDNLVYLKRMNTVFKGPAPATGMMFKGWQTRAPGPGIVLKNNIFMADAPAGLKFHNSSASLGLPRNGNLRGCENNVFVWLGQGPFPDQLPSCFRVTTDRSVWDNAVARWKAVHPNAR